MKLFPKMFFFQEMVDAKYLQCLLTLLNMQRPISHVVFFLLKQGSSFVDYKHEAHGNRCNHFCRTLQRMSRHVQLSEAGKLK